MVGFPCAKAVVIVLFVELLFKDIEASVIKRQSDYAMYDYNFSKYLENNL